MNTTHRTRGRYLAAAMIVGWVALLSSPCWGQHMSAEQPPIPVRFLVFNYSAASPTTLRIAERQASRILGQAGLHVSWLWCPVPPTPDSDPSCAAEVGPKDVRIRIVNLPGSNYLGEDIFGFTVAPAVATVYYGQALRIGKSDGLDYEIPVILGCVIAHEIGHLLLGPGAHAAIGIMQAQWKREHIDHALKGQLLFTDKQAERIRFNTTSRWAEPTGPAKPDLADLRTAP